MPKLPTIKIVVERWRRRLFIERQLYFRANGAVRFVSVSPRAQTAGVVLGLCFLGWVVYASANVVLRDPILAAKERRIEEMSQSYYELDAQMQQLQTDLINTTTRLQEQQDYLHQILGETTLAAETPEPKEPAAKEPVLDKVSSRLPRANILSRILKTNAKPEFSPELMREELQTLDLRQRGLAQDLAAMTTSTIEAVDQLLRRTGLSKEKVLALAQNAAPQNAAPPISASAQGGPFIPLDDADNPDDPFSVLLQRRNELQALQTVLEGAPFAQPLDHFYISSKFGARSDPFHGRRALHAGVDLAGAGRNAPVKASAPGWVTSAGRNGPYGNFVEIDHGNGFITRYAHMRRIEVQAGQTVRAGQEIGIVGSTGRSTGAHLHYEIWFDGKQLNPQNFFKAADDVLTLSRMSHNG